MIPNIRLFVLALAAFGAANAAKPPTYQDNMVAAREAFADEDWTDMAAHLDAAQLLRPYSLYVMKNRVLAHEMAGDRGRALMIVREVVARGLSIELSGHEAFDQLTADLAFAEIGAQMDENAEPYGSPFLIEVTGKVDLLPEAIAQHNGESLLIGGVRNGEVLPLGAGPALFFADGGVFDIEIRSDMLWVAVNNQLAFINAEDAPPFAAVMTFDRHSGEEISKILLGGDDALIGDIEIAGDGTIYASDSVTPRIFKIDPAGDRRVASFANPRFVNLQGIALDEGNGRLFVADYLTGLYSMDLESGEATLLRNDANAHLGGIDGLYLYDEDLIGIQNGTTPQRIVRIELSDDAKSATELKVLAQALPEWNEPTHGAVMGDKFYYIATSNWPSYDAENGWAEREDKPLQPLRIMSVDLD